MRRTNLIELQSGVNKIEFTSDDFPVANSKTPIAILPLGTKIVDAFFDVKIPFKSGNFPNQITPDSAIIARPMLGIKSDSQSYLIYETCDVAEKNSSNSGSYFSAPSSYDTAIDVVLENWLSPRVWTMGGDLATARYSLGGAGTQTAGLSFGGQTSTWSSVTEEYNGASWSGGGALSVATSSLAGAGSQTAGLAFGGYSSGVSYQTTTQEYNGASWSGSGALNTGRRNNKGCGTQPAALAFGGEVSGGVNSGSTEDYNGSIWSNSNDMNTARQSLGGCGTLTAALNNGGYTTVRVKITEEYNGSSWAIANDLNTTSDSHGCVGSQVSSVMFGGYDGNDYKNSSEEYDGLTWYVVNSLNIKKQRIGGSGQSSSGLCFGGQTLEWHDETEEYNSADMSTISMNGTLILNLTVI